MAASHTLERSTEFLQQQEAACPTQTSKSTAAQKAGPYETDHVFEVQLVLRFLDMLRGNPPSSNNVRLHPNYAPAYDD